MTTVTVVGPLKSRSEADTTAEALGRANHTVYSKFDPGCRRLRGGPARVLLLRLARASGGNGSKPGISGTPKRTIN